MKDVNEKIIQGFVKIMTIVASEAKRNFPKEYSGDFFESYVKHARYMSEMHVSLAGMVVTYELLPLMIMLSSDEIALAIGLSESSSLEAFKEAVKKCKRTKLPECLNNVSDERAKDFIDWLVYCREKLSAEAKVLVAGSAVA